MANVQSFTYGQQPHKGRRVRAGLRIRYTDANGRVVDEDAAKLVAAMIARSALSFAEIAEQASKGYDTPMSPATVSRLAYGDTTHVRAMTLVRLAGVFGFVLIFQRVS